MNARLYSMMLCALVVGCGDLEFVTRHGIAVFAWDTAWLDQEDLEQVTQHFAEDTAIASTNIYNWSTQDVEASFHGINLYLFDKPLKLGDEDVPGLFFAGETAASRIKLYVPPKATTCQTAFWHESIHNALFAIEGIWKPGTDLHVNALMKIMEQFPCR